MGIDNAHNTEQMLSSNWTDLHGYGQMINWGLWGIPLRMGEIITTLILVLFATATVYLLALATKYDF